MSWRVAALSTGQRFAYTAAYLLEPSACIAQQMGGKIIKTRTAGEKQGLVWDPLNYSSESNVPDLQERRSSERLPLIRPCPYQLSRVAGAGDIELSQGYALSINISSGGMLLFMHQAPGERQVFEVEGPSVAAQEQHSITRLAEVCWTRQIPMIADTTMHLVGIRFLFEVPSSQ